MKPQRFIIAKDAGFCFLAVTGNWLFRSGWSLESGRFPAMIFPSEAEAQNFIESNAGLQSNRTIYVEAH